MKIPTNLQPYVAVAALLIAPRRVLRGCSKKQHRQLLEMEAIVQESEAARQAEKARRPIRVACTRLA